MPTPRQNTSIPGMGRRLRSLRERHKMTQEEAAKRIGLSVDGYRHWEHGRSDGLLRKLQETADAFYLSVPDLLVELGFVETALPDQAGLGNLSSITPAHVGAAVVRGSGHPRAAGQERRRAARRADLGR